MKVKEKAMGIINRMDFSEYIEEKSKCPECEKQSLIRHIRKEPSQKWAGKWYVEYCTGEDCTYWDCGFLPKKYKPKAPSTYRFIPDETTKIVVNKNG